MKSKHHSRLFLTALIFTALLFCPLISGKPSARAEEDRPVRIMCYGDSNTYGYDPDPGNDRYPASERWTGILQERLGGSCEIIEEGKNGRKTGYPDSITAAASEEGPQDLEARLEKNRPVDILVIMLGTNDCIPSAGLSAEEIAEGMEALVSAAEDQADEDGIPRPSVILVVPAAFNDELMERYPSQDIKEMIEKSHRIGDLYKEIAAKHNCLFVDGRDCVETSSLDGSHLTANGHRQLAGILYDVISGMENT